MMAIETGYKRELSTFDLVAIGVGTVLGSGWLFLPAVVVSTSGPSSILAWLFGAAAMFLMAVVFAELAGAWPEAGGVARGFRTFRTARLPGTWPDGARI